MILNALDLSDLVLALIVVKSLVDLVAFAALLKTKKIFAPLFDESMAAADQNQKIDENCYKCLHNMKKIKDQHGGPLCLILFLEKPTCWKRLPPENHHERRKSQIHSLDACPNQDKFARCFAI